MTEILIVDDELGIRNILSEILAESGYRVATAADAAEARAVVAEHHFDLVLLDIWMPDVDGLTLLREWKYAGALTFPVIVMSGHGSIEHAKRAMEDGAVDFIEKPISLKRLLSGIKSGLAKWADQRRQLEEARGKERRGRRRGGNEPRGALPAFDIKEYGLTLDFNRPFRDALFEFERAYFRTVLMHLNQSMAELARHAGMERTHLYRKIRTLGIDVEAMREEARRGQLVPPAAPARPLPDGSSVTRIDVSNTLAYPTGSTLDSVRSGSKAK